MSLKGFPRRTLRGERTIYRIHKSAATPWWFSSAGDGCFDPVGAGMGACYLAEAPLGAWVEVFRKCQLLAEAEIAQRSLLAVYGLALFSQAGAPDPADPQWPPDSAAIPDALVSDAERLFGYRVLPTP